MSDPREAARRMSKIRKRTTQESDKVIGAEVGRALLSATMGRDSHIAASLNNFSDPIAIANETQLEINQRSQLQTQILSELDTFLGLADLSLLRLKLHQQQQQNRKLLQRNTRIAKRTTDRLIRAAHTGDSTILLQQLTTSELESIKLASMTLSDGERTSGGEEDSGEGGGGGGGGSGGGGTGVTGGGVCGEEEEQNGRGREEGDERLDSSDKTRRRQHAKKRQTKAQDQTKDKAKASNRRRKSKKSKSPERGSSREGLGRELLRGRSVEQTGVQNERMVRSRSLPVAREKGKSLKEILGK